MNEESLEKCTICYFTIEEAIVRITRSPGGLLGCLHAFHLDCLQDYTNSDVNHIEAFGYNIFKCPYCSRPFTHYQEGRDCTVLTKYPQLQPVNPVYKHLFDFMAHKQDFGENDPRLPNTQDVERDFAIKLRYVPTEAAWWHIERGHEGDAYTENEEAAEALALHLRELNAARLERRMREIEKYEEGRRIYPRISAFLSSLTDNKPLMAIIILIIFFSLMFYLISLYLESDLYRKTVRPGLEIRGYKNQRRIGL